MWFNKSIKKGAQMMPTTTKKRRLEGLLDRKLVCHNYTNLDTSPVGEKAHAKWDNARQERELNQRKIASLNLLSTQRQRMKLARITNDTTDGAGKVYRT